MNLTTYAKCEAIGGFFDANGNVVAPALNDWFCEMTVEGADGEEFVQAQGFWQYVGKVERLKSLVSGNAVMEQIESVQSEDGEHMEDAYGMVLVKQGSY